jgi:predicted amidohydrolase YtcJ
MGWLLSLTVACGLIPAAGAAEGKGADLILRHGIFYTVEPPARIEGSLAVKEGRIAYLGADGGVEAWRGSQTRVVELAGRAVTPGLIDAHSHLLGLGRALSQVDLQGATTYGEVIRRVRERARQTPAGAWVYGRGWDQNLWPGRQFPTHAELSAAIPDHPVWLTRVDGHAALVNAAALTTLALDAATPDPAGGRFLRDPAGGLTGVLVDNAQGVAGRKLPEPTAADRARWIEAAARHCLALGLTGVTDMGVSQADYDAYAGLRHADRLPIRVSLFLTDDEALLAQWFRRGPEIDPKARLQVRGVKLYADGALGSRGAALLEPYSDDPGNLGLLVTPPAHLQEVAGRAATSGFQVAIHAIGDRGSLLALDALEGAMNGAGAKLRFRLEHAQVLRLADIERLGRLGVIASMQPTHATSDMGWAGDRLGERRLAGAYAWQKVRAAAIVPSNRPTPASDSMPR